MLELIKNNLELIVQIQLVLAALSGLFEALKLTSISKVLGTIAVIDFGRLVRVTRSVKPKPPTGGAVILPMLLAVSVAAFATQGCAFFKKAGPVVDGLQSQCATTLTDLPEVIEEAEVRGVPIGVLVDGFCKLVDVAAIFTEPKPASGGPRLAAQKPADQALALLRAKGEIK